MVLFSNEFFGIYGFMVMFEDLIILVVVVEKVCDEGYVKMNCYMLYLVVGVWEVIGYEILVLKIIFVGGFIGCIGGFFFIIWIQIVVYLWNIVG